MLSFPELLKEIRKNAGLTQQKLSEKLDVSKVLIVKLENGTKEPSKKFISTLSKQLDVNPVAILPFVAYDRSIKISNIEKKILKIGNNLQEILIRKKAKRLSTTE